MKTAEEKADELKDTKVEETDESGEEKHNLAPGAEEKDVNGTTKYFLDGKEVSGWRAEHGARGKPGEHNTRVAYMESKASIESRGRTCEKCRKAVNGMSNCCAKGASWDGLCSDEEDAEYSWLAGYDVCNGDPSQLRVPLDHMLAKMHLDANGTRSDLKHSESIVAADTDMEEKGGATPPQPDKAEEKINGWDRKATTIGKQLKGKAANLEQMRPKQAAKALMRDLGVKLKHEKPGRQKRLQKNLAALRQAQILQGQGKSLWSASGADDQSQ